MPKYLQPTDHFVQRDYIHYDVKSVDDWSSVLRTASKLDMKKIRALAIDRLSSIASAADKFSLATEFGIKEWLVPAYTELCMRFEPLTIEEGKKLGVETVIKIGEMRHEIMDNLKRFVDSGKLGKRVEEQFGAESVEDKGQKRT